MFVVTMMGVYYTIKTMDTNSIKELSMIVLMPIAFFIFSAGYLIRDKLPLPFKVSIIVFNITIAAFFFISAKIIGATPGLFFRIFFWVVILGQVGVFIYYSIKFPSSGVLKIVRSPMNLPVIIFVLIGVASFIYTFFTPIPLNFVSRFTMIKQVVFAFTFFLIANLIRKRWQLNTLLYVMIVVAGLCALYGFAQRLFTLDEILFKGREKPFPVMINNKSFRIELPSGTESVNRSKISWIRFDEDEDGTDVIELRNGDLMEGKIQDQVVYCQFVESRNPAKEESLPTAAIVSIHIRGRTWFVRNLYVPLQKKGIMVAWAGHGRIPSTFGNPNFFAAYIVLMFPLALTLIVVSRRFFKMLWPATVAVMLLVCLRLTITRGGWLGFAGEMIFYFLVFVLVVERKQVARKLSFWIIIVVMFVGGTAYVFKDKGVIDRIKGTIEQIDDGTGTVGSRMVFYRGAWKMFADKPVFGQGIGTFQMRFPFFRQPDYLDFHVSHNTRHAHCEYLELLGETGVIGLVGFLAVVTAAMYAAGRNLKTARSRYYRHITLGLTASIVGILTHNLVSVNLRWIEAGFFLWFNLGLLAAVCRLSQEDVDWESVPKKEREQKARELEDKLFIKVAVSQKHRWIVLAGYCAAAVIICFLFIKIYLAFFNSEVERKSGVLHLELTQKPDPPRAKKHFENSIKLYPPNLSSLYKVAFIYSSFDNKPKEALTQYKEITKYSPHYSEIHANIALLYLRMAQRARADKDPQRTKEMLEKAVEESKLAVKIQDTAKNRMLLMDIYLKLGKDELAEEQSKVARKKEPDNIGILLTWSKVLAMKGRTDKAEQELKAWLKDHPDNLAVSLELAGLYVAQKKIPENAKVLEALNKKYPNNPEIHFRLGLTYYWMDRKYKARSELQRALKIAPKNNLRLKDIKKLLKDIELELEQ